MTLVVRESIKGVTIKATGSHADRLRWHIALALAPEGTENGQEPLPNAPKEKSQGTGAPLALRIATAVQFRRGS